MNCDVTFTKVKESFYEVTYEAGRLTSCLICLQLFFANARRAIYKLSIRF